MNQERRSVESPLKPNIYAYKRSRFLSRSDRATTNWRLHPEIGRQRHPFAGQTHIG